MRHFRACFVIAVPAQNSAKGSLHPGYGSPVRSASICAASVVGSLQA